MITLVDILQLDGVIRKGQHLSENRLTASTALTALKFQIMVITLIITLKDHFAIDIPDLEGSLAHHTIIGTVIMEDEPVV